MNPLYRVWWRVGLSSRILLRFYAERFPKFAPSAIRLRWLAHIVAGHPLLLVALAVGLAVAVLVDPVVGLALAVVGVAGAEVLYRAQFESGSLVVVWRLAWWFRRVFPRLWADYAAKTKHVQAEVGTSKEPVSSARLRPVADHPKMSWRPKMSWPTVSWWVSAPPGRTFAEFAAGCPQLTAAAELVESIEVDYDHESASHGRLIVSFADVLSARRVPDWATEIDDTDPGDSLLLEDDFDAAFDEYDSIKDPS